MRCNHSHIENVLSVLLAEDVFNAFKDDKIYDFQVKLETSAALVDPTHYILMPSKHSVVWFKPFNGSTLEIHPNVRKFHRKNAKLDCRKAVEWIFRNTDCLSIVAFIPKILRNVILFASNICGMNKVGFLPRSVTKDGLESDLQIFHIGKEEALRKLKEN